MNAATTVRAATGKEYYDEKRRAIACALADPEWSSLSDCEIARRHGVSNAFVRGIRAESPYPRPDVVSCRNRHGGISRMNVSNIGKRRRKVNAAMNALGGNRPPKRRPRDPEVDWIDRDPVARAMLGNAGRTPFRKGDFPTTVSRDGRYIYLASIDIAVPLDAHERVRALFDGIYERLKHELAAIGWSCRRAAMLETDYLALWEILYDAGALPDDYAFPEYYLELAWRQSTPRVMFTRDIPFPPGS